MNEFKYDPALGSFKGWLLTLTKWRISDQYRRRQQKEHVRWESLDETARTSDIESQADEQGLQLDAVWEAEWQNNLMAAAIDRVKRKVGARQYQLFDLYVIKQWSVDEVAKTLKVSVSQVYQAKSRITPLIRSEVEILEKKHI